MRVLLAILFLFIANFSGCVNHSVSIEIDRQSRPSTVLFDEMEDNLMNLYNAAADTRHAVQQETTVCLSGFSVRVLPNRTRTVSNVSIRQVLLSTHKPAVSRLIHHSVTQLVAFPKEYHIFRLRRILV
ncbi:MAG: hypothetical protein IJP44_03875 [Bacteroidales bacterium]|nr:hypothetical protein [Bacteroidales bacterium]